MFLECIHPNTKLMGGELGKAEYRCEVYYCPACRQHRVIKIWPGGKSDSGWLPEEEL